jgi:Zn-dependent membrane protease YugP
MATWPKSPGVTAAAFAVSVAALLVTVPAEFDTTTRNVDPLSEVVVAGVV